MAPQNPWPPRVAHAAHFEICLSTLGLTKSSSRQIRVLLRFTANPSSSPTDWDTCATQLKMIIEINATRPRWSLKMLLMLFHTALRRVPYQSAESSSIPIRRWNLDTDSHRESQFSQSSSRCPSSTFSSLSTLKRDKRASMSLYKRVRSRKKSLPAYEVPSLFIPARTSGGISFGCGSHLREFVEYVFFDSFGKPEDVAGAEFHPPAKQVVLFAYAKFMVP